MPDLTPDKDGILNVNLEDDVICGATICHQGKVTFPPLHQIQAIGKQEARPKPVELTAEKATREVEGNAPLAGVRQGCFMAACSCR